MTPITDREVGVIQQKLDNIEHRQRNDRMIINAVADDNVTIREKIDQVRLELNQFKYKAYGISSAVVVVLGILALIIDLLKGL
tara:strand:+ start:3842 stop:4090 length:249 start_codon:yes stop_codon:yes gene_type:complete